MGNREEDLRQRIESQYGSIPKFCEASGLPKSTVYNIFDRGVQNTRTRTMEKIFYYLHDYGGELESERDDSKDEFSVLFYSLDEEQREAVIATMRAMLK